METLTVGVGLARPEGVEVRPRGGVVRDLPRSGAEGEKTDTSGVMPGSGDQPTRPDTEVTERPKWRRYTTEYKLRVLKEADACTNRGEVGALLRREGLYSSLLGIWRSQRNAGAMAGLAPKRRGRKAAPVNPLQAKLDQVEREKRVLEKKLARVYVLLDIQKKASELLGIPLNTPEIDEKD